jgi:hypothetical protein
MNYKSKGKIALEPDKRRGFLAIYDSVRYEVILLLVRNIKYRNSFDLFIVWLALNGHL